MTQPLRVVAVDDEQLSLHRIELLLKRVPDIEFVGAASDVTEALQLIERLDPDVLLLDIEMGQLNGFDLIERLAGPNVPIVVFVTAFDHFASKAFEFGAVDYVLKPLDFTRLSTALDKARRRLAAHEAHDRIAELHQVVAALRAHARANDPDGYETVFWGERENEFVRIPVDDLDLVEAERDYVRLHTTGQSLLMRETISAVEARLDPELFVRVRRSTLVRVTRVAGIRRAGYGDFRISLTDGREIRVGRTYVRRINKFILPRLEEGAAVSLSGRRSTLVGDLVPLS